MSGRPSRRRLQFPIELPWRNGGNQHTGAEGNRLSAPDESAIASDSEDTSGSTLSEETRNRMEQMKRRNEATTKRLLEEQDKAQRKKKSKTNHGFNIWKNKPDGKGCCQHGSPKEPEVYGRKVKVKVTFFCVGDYTDVKREQYVKARKRLSSDPATTYNEILKKDDKIKALNSKFKSLGSCPVCMDEFSFDDDLKCPCILLKNDEHTLKVEKSNCLGFKYDADTCEPIDTSVAQICRHNLCRACANKLVDDNRNYYDIESVRVLPVSTTEAVQKNASVSRLPTCPTCRKPFIGVAGMKRVNNASALEAHVRIRFIRFVREIDWTNMNKKNEPRVSYWPCSLDPVLDKQQRIMITKRYTILTPSVYKDHLLESGNREEDEAVKKAMNMLRAFVAYEVSEGKNFQQQEHELPKGFLTLINDALSFMVLQKAVRHDVFVQQNTEYVQSMKKEFYSFVKIFNKVASNFREYYPIPYECLLSKTYTFIQDMVEKDRVPICIEEEEEHEDMNGGSGAKGYTSDDDPNVMLV